MLNIDIKEIIVPYLMNKLAESHEEERNLVLVSSNPTSRDVKKTVDLKETFEHCGFTCGFGIFTREG